MKVNKRAAAAVTAVVVAASIVALPDIKKWEGLVLKPQPDRLAYDIPNVCYGETRVVMRTYTPAECEAMALRTLQRDFGPAAVASAPVLGEPGRVHQLAAVMLLSYNIGSAAFHSSTAACRFNGGEMTLVGKGLGVRRVCRLSGLPPTPTQMKRACEAFLLFNRAGGRVVRGLQNRRAHERLLCLEGL